MTTSTLLGAAPLSVSLSAVSQPADLDGMSAAEVQARYRPFASKEGSNAEDDWVSQLEIDFVTRLSLAQARPIRVAVLYGSLRTKSV